MYKLKIPDLYNRNTLCNTLRCFFRFCVKKLNLDYFTIAGSTWYSVIDFYKLQKVFPENFDLDEDIIKLRKIVFREIRKIQDKNLHREGKPCTVTNDMRNITQSISVLDEKRKFKISLYAFAYCTGIFFYFMYYNSKYLSIYIQHVL